MFDLIIRRWAFGYDLRPKSVKVALEPLRLPYLTTRMPDMKLASTRLRRKEQRKLGLTYFRHSLR